MRSEVIGFKSFKKPKYGLKEETAQKKIDLLLSRMVPDADRTKAESDSRSTKSGAVGRTDCF